MFFPRLSVHNLGYWSYMREVKGVDEQVVDLQQLVDMYQNFYKKYEDDREFLGLNWTPTDYKKELKRRYQTKKHEGMDVIKKSDAKEWAFCWARFFDFDETKEFQNPSDVDLSGIALSTQYKFLLRSTSMIKTTSKV